MRVWISGGGTAGHVYPALTVLEAAGPELSEPLWVGTASGMEASIARRHGLPFLAIPAGPLVGANPLRFARNVALLAGGAVRSWHEMGRRRPDAVLVTGGYVAVPVALAARARRVPVAVFLPDVRPGRAVSLIAKVADVVTTTAESARQHLPRGKTVVTGYPVRPAVRAARREESLQRLGLTGDKPVVLVFGGSQGARRLNQAVAGAAQELLVRADLVHVAGRLDVEAAEKSRQAIPPALRAGYVLREFLHDEDMAAALAAADLVVSRAGASVMGEYPARGLASILVPLPIAGGHQRLNADELAGRGAAVVLEDAACTGEAMLQAVLELLDDPDRLARMGRAAAQLDRPDAAAAIWRQVKSLSGRPPDRSPAASPGAAA
ncbi:MAG: UDP-N-acetylglucosamine--N-acetylmuramyl-(pentapeptide) pyrophosphoryl-undecaprenol N-acetylglucosamine transferase [Anaerolineae bacterium]